MDHPNETGAERRAVLVDLDQGTSALGQQRRFGLALSTSGLPQQRAHYEKRSACLKVPLAEAMLMAKFVCIRTELSVAPKWLETGPDYLALF